MKGKLFLVRHADYFGNGSDPVLSDYGKRHALALAKKIKEELEEIRGDTTIWTSSAKRAQETAKIVKQELQLTELVVYEKLWSDDKHQEDFNWLKQELRNFDGKNLIIFSHQEYVNLFPVELGFEKNDVSYAQGVLIYNRRLSEIR